MYNAKCFKCGSPGYQGFVDFECSNTSCDYHKQEDSSYHPAPVNTASGSLPGGAGFPVGSLHTISGPTPTNSQMVSILPVLSQPPGCIEHQQEAAIAILNILFTQDSNGDSIIDNGEICGGAPRDWWCGKLAKDIDIFVTNFNSSLFRSFFGLTIIAASHSSKKSYPSSFTVWNFNAYGYDFQIIDVGSKTIKEHVETFDFGINMIRVDRYGMYHRHLEFDKDINNTTLTMYPAKMNPVVLPKLHERYVKMQQKFPGWRLEIGQ